MALFVSFVTIWAVLRDIEAFVAKVQFVFITADFVVYNVEVIDKTYFPSESCFAVLAESLVTFGKLRLYAYQKEELFLFHSLLLLLLLIFS